MDARTLLETVAETYAKLRSFEVEIASTSESGDEDSSTRRTQRGRGYFVGPDRVRIEQNGLNGTVTVSDGRNHHHYFRLMKRYSSWRLEEGAPVPGSFDPRTPLASGQTFLFGKIAEGVTAAEILPQEADGLVVARATYGPLDRDSFVVARSPLTYWIDTRTHLVLRVEGEVTHLLPRGEERQASKTSVEFRDMLVDQTIPAQTFEYTPPPDTMDEADPRNRPGGRSWNNGPDETKRFETWRLSNWEGDAFVDQFELKIRGVELNFERRVTFEDENVKVDEKITGPQGVAEREIVVRVVA